MTRAAAVRAFKEVARDVLPSPALAGLRRVRGIPAARQRRAARRMLAAAAPAADPLPYVELERLQAEYPVPTVDYGYDPTALATRGSLRAQELLAMPGMPAAKDVLELGAWDGLVSAALQDAGKTATAVDVTDRGFDQRARDAGVRTVVADAAALDFPDASFDFVFSYDAFEHFADPPAVLEEIVRVVRPGGHVYLWFGPLWLSARGAHAYRSINVPYCQVLFAEETIEELVRRHDLPQVNLAQCNKWRVADFRQLWERTPELQRLRYEEGVDCGSLELLMRYPAHFKRVSASFEDFTVTSVAVLFERGPDVRGPS